MNKILILIFIFKNVIGYDEESNERYIDLLPEEEKQEFLNRIARRILERINSKDTPNESHADITDDQLDAHDAFVKEILKEESYNLKKEKRRPESKEVKENNNDRVESHTDDKEDHTDLTLREEKRPKRKNSDSEFEKETITEIPYDFIPVKTIYDQFENDDVKVDNQSVTSLKENSTLKIEQESKLTNEGEENITITEKGQEGNVNEDDNVNIINNISNSSNLIQAYNASIRDSHKSNNTKKFRTSFHNKSVGLRTSEMKDFETNSNENFKSADYNSNDEETKPLPITVLEKIPDSITNYEDNRVSTQKIHDKNSEEKNSEKKEETTKVYNTISNGITEMIVETYTTSRTVVEISGNDTTNTETVLEKIPDSMTNYEDNRVSTQKINDKNNEENKSEKKEETTTVYSTTSNDITETITETNTTSRTVVEISGNDRTNTEIGNLNESKDNFFRSITDSIEDVKFERNVTETVMSTANHTIKTTSESIPLLSAENTLPNKSVSEVKTGTELESIENLRGNKTAFTKSVNVSTSIDHVDIKYVEKDTKIANSQETLKNNKTILKVVLENMDLSQIDKNEYVQNFDEDSNNMKVYEVFEVDTDHPHFITTSMTQQNEHPQYVPVYDHTAHNAYLPYNRFGLKIEDQKRDSSESNKIEDQEQFNLRNARNSFSRFSDNKKRNIKQSITKQANQIQKPKQNIFMEPVTQNLVNQEIYYNPDDYADLDYYYARILRRANKQESNNANKSYFPESNEDDHPISSIHKSDAIKDHVRAIRNILYLQNLLGYKPQANEKTFRKTNEDIRKGRTPKRNEKYKISVDYYFGRADPIEIDNNSKEHNINSIIAPLTPNPLNFESDSDYMPKKQDISKYKDSESVNREINSVPFKKLFESMIVVLKDMIKVKNEKLVKYDWLKTTVNIQAALLKLLDLTEQLKNGEFVHPKDIELVKYTIYLFKSSKTALEEQSMNTNLNSVEDKKSQIVKRNKSIIKFPKTKGQTKIKEPIKLWKAYATVLRSEEAEEFDLLNEFEDMLHNLRFYLNDLHDSIKHISVITKYSNQNWFEDLKAVYLGEGNKEYLAKTILHLSLSRLLDSIEDSSTRGVEENFRNFVKKNRDSVRKSKEDCLLVLNVLDELRKFNESLSSY